MEELFLTMGNLADGIIKEAKEAEEMKAAPIYIHTLSYADKNGESDLYFKSAKENIKCKEAIEESLSQHFDGIRLESEEALSEVVGKCGMERTLYVLANTVNAKEWDGRFSPENRKWAAEYQALEDDVYVSNGHWVVNSHPGVVDLFTTTARKEANQMKERSDMSPAKAEDVSEEFDQNIDQGITDPADFNEQWEPEM